MSFDLRTRLPSFARRLGLCAVTALVAVSPAQAGKADAVLTLEAVPTVASVSRDATATEPAADFRAAYRVSIYNPSNSSKNFRFVGNVTVAGQGSTPPTQFVSSRPDCTLTGTNPVEVMCPKLEVAKGATINFQLEFRTPTVGSQMNLWASLYFPASNGTLTASGTVSTQLVKLDYIDYTLGFNTFVPKTGGTFFSGVASTLAGSPGGVATTGDPFTTTIVVPPIPFTTTALVVELQRGELDGCSLLYASGGCFESNLTIPSASGALAGLTIYLRMDRSRINFIGSNIADAVLSYTKDGVTFVTVPNCTAPGVEPAVVATSGRPCIRARKAYPGSPDIPDEWKFDWEFRIEAVDNGRYVNL